MMLKIWELIEPGSLSQNQFKWLISYCLFHNILTLKPWTKVHSLFSSSLSSMLLDCFGLHIIEMLLKFRFKSFGGNPLWN